MADFCTECSKVIGLGVDIPIRELANEVQPGYMIDVLCEGCGMRAIAKDTDGTVYVLVPEDIADFDNVTLIPVKLKDFENDHSTKYCYHKPSKPELKNRLSKELETIKKL